MSDFINIIKNLDWTVPLRIVMNILPSLFCITLHELSHGYVAYRLGDTTARDAGRLTLNPLRHIDVMGLLMMIVFRFGWAKPVPVNMYRFKNPKKGMAITALAGPVCNVLLACALLFLYGVLYYPLSGHVPQAVLRLIYNTASLSLSLAVFNFLPIPPLDGSKVLFALVDERHYSVLMRYERYGMILLFILVSTNILGTPLSAVHTWLMDKLFVLAELGFRLVTHLI